MAQLALPKTGKSTSVARQRRQRGYIYRGVQLFILLAVMVSMLYAAIGGNDDLSKHHARDDVLPYWLYSLSKSKAYIYISAIIFSLSNCFSRILRTVDLIDDIADWVEYVAWPGVCRVFVETDKDSDVELILGNGVLHEDEHAQEKAAVKELLNAVNRRFCFARGDVPDDIIFETMPKSAAAVKLATVLTGAYQALYTTQQFHSRGWPLILSYIVSAISGVITIAFRYRHAEAGVNMACALFRNAGGVGLKFAISFLFLMSLLIAFIFPYYYAKVYGEQGYPKLWGWKSHETKEVAFWTVLTCSYLSAAPANLKGFLRLVTGLPVQFFKKLKHGINSKLFAFAAVLSGSDTVLSTGWAAILMLHLLQPGTLGGEIGSWAWILSYGLFFYGCYYAASSAIPSLHEVCSVRKNWIEAPQVEKGFTFTHDHGVAFYSPTATAGASMSGPPPSTLTTQVL